MSDKMTSMAKKHCTGLAISIVALLIITLIACGAKVQTAGGGIGGTGISVGVISGFGSIFVNEIEYNTSSAVIMVDGNSVSESELAVGMKVAVNAANDSALSVTFESEVRGPLDGPPDTVNNTITVLGQTISVDSTTVYKGVSDIAGLNTADNIRVSGFFDANGNIRATFIEKETTAPQMIEVKGTVSDFMAGPRTFKINDLQVDYTLVQDPPDISNGSFVEIEGALQGSIFMATDMEIEDEGPSLESGDDVEIEGIITYVTSQSDFEVNGQRVLTNAQTEFEHGTSADIIENVRVEVEGTVDSNGNLIAEEVEFRFLENRDTKIEGAVASVDTQNSTVTVFGITIQIDGSTELKDESQSELQPFNLTDLNQGDFVEIGGFVNSNGNVIATKLERDDDPGPGKDTLKGPVDSETPNTALEILGINIDVTGAAFRDTNDTTIDADTFYGTIEEGDLVKIRGSYSGGIFSADKADIKKLN